MDKAARPLGTSENLRPKDGERYPGKMMMMSCDVGSLPDAFELSDPTPLLRASEQGLEKPNCPLKMKVATAKHVLVTHGVNGYPTSDPVVVSAIE